jgi:hypothetical protein
MHSSLKEEEVIQEHHCHCQRWKSISFNSSLISVIIICSSSRIEWIPGMGEQNLNTKVDRKSLTHKFNTGDASSLAAEGLLIIFCSSSHGSRIG